MPLKATDWPAAKIFDVAGNIHRNPVLTAGDIGDEQGERRESKTRIRHKIDEYLAFGVAYVWLVDPETRRADVYTPSQIYEAKDLILRTEDPAIEVPLAELFQALDE